MNKAKKSLIPLALTIFLTCFILFFSGFAIWSAFLDFDLVSEDYYQKGVEYQRQIERRERASENNLRVIWNQTAQGSITFKFPISSDSAAARGKLTFFRPSDAALDKIVNINPDSAGLQEISIRRLSKGYWKIKIFWSLNSHELYQEDDLIVK